MGEDRLESLVLVDSPITSVCEQAHSKPHTNGGGGGVQSAKYIKVLFENFSILGLAKRSHVHI